MSSGLNMISSAQKIFDGDRLVALLILREFSKDGIEFFTPPDFSQQLGYMKRPRGYRIDAHVHKEVSREVRLTQEVLIVRSGRVRIDFYGLDRRYLESRVLEPGDVVVLAAGGHGLEMLEETEILEIKQGPYADEGDKVRFPAVDSEDIRVKHE